MTDRLRTHFSLANAIFVLSFVQFVWLVWFFYTGFGGSLELVARVMSIALALQVLFMYQQDYLYKWLPPILNHLLVAVYLGICVIAFVYFHYEFERIAIYSQGTFTQNDYIVGLLVFLLVMELSQARAPGAVLDQRAPRCLHAVGLSQPDRFLLASGHVVQAHRHVEHGGVLDRHLRHLRPARAHADCRLPAARRHRQRLRCPAGDDQRGARARGPVAAADPADRGGGIERHRHDQRQRLGQCRRRRHHHDPADDPLRRASHLRRRRGDGGLDGRPHHAADDGRRRVPDVGVPRRALLGRRAARVCARDRVLRLDRHRRLPAVRAPAAQGSDRAAAGAALRKGQDGDLLLVRALPALSHGLRRQGRAAGRALHRHLHARCCWSPLTSTSSTCARTRPSGTRRCR